MKMRLILRSGAQVDVDVTEFTVKRNRFDGSFVGLDWTTPVGYAAKLSFVRLEEVAAIVTLAEVGDDGDEPASGTYAHDAHCNTIHTPGPQPCPPTRDADAPPVVSIPAQAAVVALDALEQMDALEGDEVRAKGYEAAWGAISGAINAQLPPRGPLSRTESDEHPAGVGQPTPEASEGSQDDTADGAA